VGMEGEVAMLKVSLSDGDLWSQTVIGIPFYQGYRNTLLSRAREGNRNT